MKTHVEQNNSVKKPTDLLKEMISDKLINGNTFTVAGDYVELLTKDNFSAHVVELVCQFCCDKLKIKLEAYKNRSKQTESFAGCKTCYGKNKKGANLNISDEFKEKYLGIAKVAKPVKEVEPPPAKYVGNHEEQFNNFMSLLEDNNDSTIYEYDINFNEHTAIDIKCSHGHEYKRSYNAYLRNDKCEGCEQIKTRQRQIKKMVDKLAELKEDELVDLSPINYVNNSTPIKIRCLRNFHPSSISNIKEIQWQHYIRSVDPVRCDCVKPVDLKYIKESEIDDVVPPLIQHILNHRNMEYVTIKKAKKSADHTITVNCNTCKKEHTINYKSLFGNYKCPK